MAIVTETAARVGSSLACSACSFISFSSSDIASLSHDFYDDPLVPLPIKLSIENPLPSSQVEHPGSNWHNHLMMNQQCFQVRVAVVFSGVVMLVVLAKWSEVLHPFVDVFDQPA